MAHRRSCKASAIFSILVLLFVSISVVSCDIQFTRGTAIQEVFEDQLVNDDVSLHPTESSKVTIRLIPDASVPETSLKYEVLIYRTMTNSNTLYRTAEVGSTYTLDLHDIPRASYRLEGRAVRVDGVVVAIGEASMKVSSNGTEAVMELKDVGHVMERHEKIDATCTEPGTIEHWHCTRCGLDFTDEEGLNHVSDTTIPAKGHLMVHVEAKAPTCAEKGTIDHWHCDRCEKDFADEEGSSELDDVAVSALGHDWSTDWSHDEHRHWHICTRCSTTGDVADHAMDVMDHRDATDDEAGYIAYKCSICGFERKDTIPPINHNWVEVSKKEPTCLEEGYIDYRCSDCGKEYREVLAKVPHSTTHVEAVAATCTEPGNHEYWYCSTCGIYYKNEACSEKFDNKAKTIIEALGHYWPTTWEKDSDKHWHVCTRPGCSAVQEEEHTYVCKVESADFIASSATCEFPAIYHYSCICGAKGSGTFTVGEPLGHEYPLVEHEETESTCTIKGNIHYWECSRCNAKFSDGEGLHQIPESESVYKNLKDHVFTDDKHPSETYRGDENGHRHVCLTCNQPIGEVQNHMEGWSFNKQFHWRACSVCDYRIGSSWEHSFVPTSDGRRCSECPYSEKDEDPRSDSGFDVGVETNDPKCRLDVVDNGDHSHTFTCTNLIGGDSITEIRWYVDNVRLDIQTTQNSIEVATPERRSYRVFCIYSNGKGYGSCEAVVTGY